ncbi:serine/threonine-protein kinase [Streptomyces sp. NRRL B-1347]|uniref:serine/threonine-protein kinase n=1 Tax=Streptomyces sp. NRRL B-1347 TaxID=1476877 RepID=UPI00068AB287|nr:serine/threonine-protein kinase [Streptomyces sp. NRRL B-1347]
MAATDPEEVGRYRTIAELGSGGMGRVFLSSAPDGRLVALKQVRTQFVEDDGFRARFRREVDASRKVSGVFTSAVIDADADAPEPWLTSEFVPGPSLQEALTAVGTLPEEAVLRMAAGLASALLDIHRAGLVHRDLKPSNVLLAADGPRVIDFGIARATDSDDSTELTHSALLVGSPGFMSPEQAQGLPLGAASDVFSLGTVLVMACTGRCPFAGTSTPQTLYNVVHTEPDLSMLPRRVRPLVARCLAKEPSERPSPAQLLEDIGGLTPAPRPWPTEVHELIAAQQAEIERLRRELALRGRVRDTGGGAPAAEGPSGGTGPAPGPARVRYGWALPLSALVAVAVGAAAAYLALAPGRDGTTTAEPPRATLTIKETTVERTTEVPRRPAGKPTAPPVREPSAAAEPSPGLPTPSDARPSTRPAAIADCGGEPVTRPALFLLACGDGGAGLKGLTWTDWGMPTARATGRGWQRVCEPSCANGREAEYPATVILTGLTAGRYTSMQVRAPQSPGDRVVDYTLDEYGPTARN